MTASTNLITELLFRHQLNGLYDLLEQKLNHGQSVDDLLPDIQEVNHQMTTFANTHKVPTVGTLNAGYQGAHRPPVNDGESPTLLASAHRLLRMIDDNCLIANEQTINSLRNLIREKTHMVLVYRAMPENQYCLNQGDWVSLSEDYARDHTERYLGDTPLVVREFLVDAKNLYTSEDSADELGFCSLGVKSTLYFKL